MWDSCQIAKHVLCNIFQTNHWINAKPTEPYIHTIIKLLVEKSICLGPNSLRPEKTKSGHKKQIPCPTKKFFFWLCCKIFAEVCPGPHLRCIGSLQISTCILRPGLGKCSLKHIWKITYITQKPMVRTISDKSCNFRGDLETAPAVLEGGGVGAWEPRPVLCYI